MIAVPRLPDLKRLLCLLPLCATLLWAPAVRAQNGLPSFEQVRAAHSSSDALLLDRHGRPLADRRFNLQLRRLDWISLQSLPRPLREALLAAEDKRFYEHEGVDWKAVAGAMWQNLLGTRRGASTLTMQLAGLLEPTLSLPDQGRGRRSLSQKWDQSVAAIELERHWSKQQILEAYLNLAPFRGDLVGIDAASQILFGLPVARLTRRESVILAALLRGPNAAPNSVARRACVLVQKLGETRLCAEITQLAQSRLAARPKGPHYTLAPHLARNLLSAAGQKIRTTIDADLQAAVQQLLDTPLDKGASVLVLDNSSGAPLVWLGGAESAADGVSQRRMLRGTTWPFAVGLALERQSVTAATPLEVAPGLQYSLRQALSTRMSTALRAALAPLPAEALSERLRALGLEPSSPAEAQDNGMAYSLGQVTSAWRSLVAQGQYVPLQVLRTELPRQVLAPESSFIVLDILSASSPNGWLAQWPLASNDGKQAMLLASSEHFSIGLASESPMSGEAQRHLQRLMLQVLVRLYAPLNQDTAPLLSQPPTAPADVVNEVLVYEPPFEAPRREWFYRSAEPVDARYRRYSLSDLP